MLNDILLDNNHCLRSSLAVYESKTALQMKRKQTEPDVNEEIKETESSRIIHLNVGGQVFQTKLETLTQGVWGDEDHYLKTLVSNKSFGKDLDENGYLFIDRNPKAFAILLDFLRTGCDINDIYKKERNASMLLPECDFYGLLNLKNILKENKNAAQQKVII